MLRHVCTIMFCTVLLTTGCTTGGNGSTHELGTVVIHVDELGPSTSNELIEQSSTIVRVTLDSILEGAGYRASSNEDEPMSEFVELIQLNFSTIETFKGESPAQLQILWDGYTVSNVDGTPAERLNRVSLAGAEFKPNNVGQSFVLFLTERDNRLDIITVTDGIAHLLPNGAISPTTTSGVLGIASEAKTIDDIRNVSSGESGMFAE